VSNKIIILFNNDDKNVSASAKSTHYFLVFGAFAYFLAFGFLAFLGLAALFLFGNFLWPADF